MIANPSSRREERLLKNEDDRQPSDEETIAMDDRDHALIKMNRRLISIVGFQSDGVD